MKSTKYLDIEFKEINKTQDEYIDELVDLLNNPNWKQMKRVNFNSDTGTGKTQMMSKLINKFPDYYFVITTLSKGQLSKQTKDRLTEYCNQDNFEVYGTQEYKINSKLQADDIIGHIPEGKKCIWLRDEGHIKTNRYDKLLENICYKVINFSATNEIEGGVNCNFMHTNMLRRVNMFEGYPEDALFKLMEVKEIHKDVPNYNPCAIFRLVKTTDKENDETYNRIIQCCKELNLKWIDITDDKFDINELCKDDNEYDVIINKFKIVEGIDIKRAHVLFMDNNPGNIKTTIQVIGRCRRNALLYAYERTGVDILDPKNEQLLADTRECFVYFNMIGMSSLEQDEYGRLQQAFCNKVSCQAIKVGKTIHVENGQMQNGLYVIELEHCTGDYKIVKDKKLGFNIVEPLNNDFYKTRKSEIKPCIYTTLGDEFYKIYNTDLIHFPINDYEAKYDVGTERVEFFKTHLYYSLDGKRSCRTKLRIDTKLIDYFKMKLPKFNKSTFKKFVNCNYTGKESQLYTQVEFVVYRYVDSLEVMNSLDVKNIEVTNEDVDYLIRRIERSIKRIKIANITEDDIDMILDDYNFNVEKLLESISRAEFILRLQIKESELKKYMTLVRPNSFEGKNLRSGIFSIYESRVSLNLVHMYRSYSKQENDYETAVIGPELMHPAKTKMTDENGKPIVIWIETKGVTSRVGGYNKFNEFINSKYEKELEQAKEQCFNGENNFRLDKKCNSMIGYCVEYYSKYLLYGTDYLGYHLDKALRESKTNTINDAIIIRACILKYKEMMTKTFSSTSLGSLIRSTSVESLIQKHNRYFVKLIKDLGTQTANFAKSVLYKDKEITDFIDPNLSIDHITGLADYITEDTILDIKVTNNVGLGYVRQVLAYHYLSTKRSDLNIKRVIVYDATSNRHVSIDISPKNWKENQPYGYKD